MDKMSLSTTGTGHFEEAAVKLSQGPLGIIALFIVLIHGFASLVLGFSYNLGEANRSILVWFVVLFPTLVFTIFAWIVSTRHYTLYHPGAFRNEKLFRELAYGRASLDRQAGRQARHPAAPESVVSTKKSLKKSAVGNLYWLGHDLMWTADTLLRQGPTQDVVIGLDQALHHLAHVGLGETPVERDLQILRAQIHFAKDLPASARDESASLIGSIIDRIGATFETAQGDFEVPPHWNRVRTERSA